jgi:hypothetical protein
MKTLALGIGVSALFALAPACAHVDRERADYHEAKAHRAAEHGNYYKAAREQRKADRAEHESEYDPLP